MTKKLYFPPKKSFVDIQNEWKTIQTLDIKNKRKAMRALEGNICASYDKNNTSVEEIECYMNIIRQTAKIRSYPQSSWTFLAKLTSDWLIKTGNDTAKILLKITDQISIDYTEVIIADPTYFSVEQLISASFYKTTLSLINQGACYVFSPAEEKSYNMQLRIINALEPVLTIKEYKWVKEASDSAIIYSPTGKIAIVSPHRYDDKNIVTQPHDLNNQNIVLSLSAIPGNYKVCVYLLHPPRKIESFIVTLCKTDSDANNTLSELYQFTCP